MTDALQGDAHIGSEVADATLGRRSATAAPLVAVVTPTYNGADYLREVMDCVQAQTYPNLVHVVLDNCSTDATSEIIASYANATVPIITARNPELLPLNANWNAALQLAPQDAAYVRLICHDDLMTPDSIERMVDVAERNPSVGVVVCDVRKFDEDSDYEDVTVTQWPADVETASGQDATRRYFRNERVIISNQVMFRKSAMAVRGREFYAEDIAGSDYDAVLAVLAKFDLGVVHAPAALTRLHGRSETSTFQTTWKFTDLEWFLAMSRHGPSAYTEAEWRELFGRYKRRYLRRMFRWRFSAQGRQVIRRHMELIRSRGLRISALDHVIAVADGIPVKLGLKPGWRSFPW